MSSQPNDRFSYSKLAQFYNCMENLPSFSMTHMINLIANKKGDINFKLPQSSSCPAEIKGSSALHIAASKNNLEVFNALIQHGADFTLQDTNGSTALHKIFNNHLTNDNEAFIKAALSIHMNLNDPSNPCDNNGISHFHLACMSGNDEVVKFFLEFGIPVDLVVNSDSPNYAGYTPLHFAIEGNDVKMVKILLENNANMHMKNTSGVSSFHSLLQFRIHRDPNSQESNEEIDELLLNYNKFEDTGISQLHLACIMQNPSLVENLLNQATKVNQTVNINSPIFAGYSALHIALNFNRLDIAKMLIERSADIDLQNAKVDTPLRTCLKKYNLNGLQLMLKTRKDQVKFRNSKVLPSDFISAITGNLEKLEKYLIEFSPDMTFISIGSSLWPGFTPLHLAVLVCRNHQVDAIELYLKRRVDHVTAQDKRGQTPVHLAFKLNKPKLVAKMLENQQEIANPSDENDLSHLHIACAVNNLSFVKKFNGVHLNSIYRGSLSYGLITPGSTLLHIAVAYGSHEILKLLLENGVDTRVKDTDGRYPINRCPDNYAPLICRLLSANRQPDEYALRETGLSWLHVAIYVEDLPLMDEVLNTYNSWKNMPVDFVMTFNDKNSAWSNYFECTPLDMALQLDSSEDVVKKLLDFKADMLRGTDTGRPLFKVLTNDHDYLEEIVDLFITRVISCKDTQDQLLEISNITPLHIACHVIDVATVQRYLLRGRVDVDINAQVFLNCSIWSGCTALHVLLRRAKSKTLTFKEIRDVGEIMDLLLNLNADVMILDGDGNTPVHLSSEYFSEGETYVWTEMLIKRHENFSLNPIGSAGISHFHAACFVNNLEAVTKFLKNGVDVNLPVDFFSTFQGKTPLHLTVDDRFRRIHDLESSMRMARVLLQHGADIHAEDAYSYTPLHRAVEANADPLLLRILCRDLSILETKTIYGEVPLELLIKQETTSPEALKFFVELGCRLDVCNPITNVAFSSMALFKNRDQRSDPGFTAFQDLIAAVDEEQANRLIRNALSNFIATVPDDLRYLFYFDLINFLTTHDYDVDQLNELGKTDLHIASQYDETSAVQALLDNGADVNILDSDGQPPLFYAINTNPCDNDILAESKLETAICLAKHLFKLKYFGAHVNQANYRLLNHPSASIDFQEKFGMNEALDVYADIMKKIEIEPQPKLVLYDFMSDDKALVDYPFMTIARREKVNEFFYCLHLPSLDIKILDVIALQHRKIKKRFRLVEEASIMMWKLAGVPVPIVCTEIIFKELSITDLDNFVKAMDMK